MGLWNPSREKKQLVGELHALESTVCLGHPIEYVGSQLRGLVTRISHTTTTRASRSKRVRYDLEIHPGDNGPRYFFLFKKQWKKEVTCTTSIDWRGVVGYMYSSHAPMYMYGSRQLVLLLVGNCGGCLTLAFLASYSEEQMPPNCLHPNRPLPSSSSGCGLARNHISDISTSVRSHILYYVRPCDRSRPRYVSGGATFLSRTWWGVARARGPRR